MASKKPREPVTASSTRGDITIQATAWPHHSGGWRVRVGSPLDGIKRGWGYLTPQWGDPRVLAQDTADWLAYETS